MVTAAGAALSESIAGCLPGDPMADRLEFVRDTLRRLAAMVPHDDEPRPPSRATDVNATLAAIYPLLQRLVGPFIRLELSLETRGAWASLLAEELEQIVLNLVVAARDALPLGGTITVAMRRRVLVRPQEFSRGSIPAGNWTLIEIRDSRGHQVDHGMAQLFDELPAVAEESGSLLGLSTVRDVVRRVGGLIVAGSAGGRGQDGPAHGHGVTVCVPAASEPADGMDGTDGPEAILVVDGDAWSRTNIAHALRRAGFGVLEADHGGTALELLHGVAGRCVRLVIADGFRTPSELGRFDELVRRRGSQSQLILVIDPLAPAMAPGIRAVAVLVRPIDNEELVRTVRAHLGAHEGPPRT